VDLEHPPDFHSVEFALTRKHIILRIAEEPRRAAPA
jgi:hypothetical protein